MLGSPNNLGCGHPYLVTGAAGFIGAAVCTALLDRGRQVVGVDNFSPYYDPALKRARMGALTGRSSFRLVEADVAGKDALLSLVSEIGPKVVIHLAAQPGVAHSGTDPLAYVQSNIVGTMNVLEACRQCRVGHLVYASSSSVYASKGTLPLSVGDPAEGPLSVYAATKRSTELMAHSYSHLFGLATTGMRFFTVYGPWGRPDMAYYSFARKLCRGEPITIFGDGTQLRDFTYIDDIVEGLIEIAEQPPAPAAGDSYRLFNLGRGEQISINRLVELLEESLGVKATVRHAPPRPADLTATRADVSGLREAIGFAPSTPVEVGIKEFARWFFAYHL